MLTNDIIEAAENLISDLQALKDQLENHPERDVDIVAGINGCDDEIEKLDNLINFIHDTQTILEYESNDDDDYLDDDDDDYLDEGY